MTPILELHDVTVAYHRRPVLWDIDLAIEQPALVGIIGPNGAGKTTLIQAILGLVPLVSGEIRIHGEAVARQRHRVGYFPQHKSVDWDFPVNVLDVVLMGTYGRVGWFRRPGAKEKAIARACLQRVGLEGLERRQIGQLSGGQQQRTFLARALAQEADVYFMDEPMAGVDAATERAIFSVLRELRDQHKTVIVVHHDLRTVTEYFDLVILLNQRLLAFGPTTEVFTPDNLWKTYGAFLPALEAAGEAVRTERQA